MARPSPWLISPALIAGTWLLSAQTPAADQQLAALERRVAELEARIAKAGTVTQVKAPFTVLGQDGRPILEVGTSPENSGGAAVIVTHIRGQGGGVYTRNEAGRPLAGMGIHPDGHGVVFVNTKSDKIGAQLNGQPGVAVWNEAGDNVAVLNTTKEGKGRLTIWDGQTRLAVLEDSAGAGNLTLTRKSDGRAVAQLGLGSGGAGRLAVMGSEGKVGAALLGTKDGGGLVAVATKGGATVAQLGVSTDNRGLIQVFSSGGAPMATMGQGGPGNGGIFQVGHPGGIKATLATAEGGGGMLQLISSGGVPTVEAGTMANGRGVVRVGPYWKCSPIQAATPVMSLGFSDCIVGGVEK